MTLPHISLLLLKNYPILFYDQHTAKTCLQTNFQFQVA